MEKTYKCIISNMCMVYKGDMILVINRTKSDWPGLSFPGGHLEENETLEESVVREMKEETGLEIKNPKLCAIKEWDWGNGVRYLGLLYSLLGNGKTRKLVHYFKSLFITNSNGTNICHKFDIS